MIGLLLACAQEYSLNLTSSPELGDGSAYAAWEEGATVSPEITAAPLTGAGRSRPRPGTGRVEAFALGPTPNPVADYLFVVDDSISMQKLLAHFHAGIQSLTAPGVFPLGSRLAVLNTTPADFDDPTQPHPAAAPNGEDDLAPGFLHLVDGPRIAAYRKVAAGRYGNRYRRAGCTPWFTPDQTNRDGQSCLLAHTQIPLLKGRPEAGLVTLRQWLESTEGTPRFRPGAAVNVLFISDTHDPGLSPALRVRLGEDAEELFDARPTLAEIESLVDEPVAAFRIHAIAPATTCGETWTEPTYFTVAMASGGIIEDACTLEDYAAMIDQIAKAGSIRQRPVLRLGFPGTVTGVQVDGRDVGWTQVDPQAIEVDGALPESTRDVRVRYRVD